MTLMTSPKINKIEIINKIVIPPVPTSGNISTEDKLLSFLSIMAF